MKQKEQRQAELEIRREDGVLVVAFAGDWVIDAARPPFGRVAAAFGGGERPERVRLEGGGLRAWDSSFLAFLRRCRSLAEEQAVTCEMVSVPEGARQLIELSRNGTREAESGRPVKTDLLARVGQKTIDAYEEMLCAFRLIGEILINALAFGRGGVRLRVRDFLFLLQTTGAAAFPIVCMLSFLTGVIIAFIGVIQLQQLAADIYVADLVGLAMTRELGAVMVGIIMAGRTGAAFAAQIGSMRVNEELDALASFGIGPVPFLVLPRVIALTLMMPLLCVCADVAGILGGLIVATLVSEVGPAQFSVQLEQAVGLADVGVGVFKSGVFGVIIALSGCYRGLFCGRDASSVGLAATSAVVTSVTWIVIADAVFAVLFHILGI